MSLKEKRRKKGTVYIVRYYDADQKKYIERTFDLKKDAQAYEAMVVLAKRRGKLDELDAGRETLAEFEQEWWSNYVEPHLAPATKRSYRLMLDKHVLPYLGRHQLRRINPRMLNAWLDEVQAGPSSRRRAFMILQGMLERAVEWGCLQSNPARIVKNPRVDKRRSPRPLAPAQVELIRDGLERDRDKALVSVLAYGGLRPGEALALTWEDVGEKTILVNKALSDGEEKTTKNNRVRNVEMLASLKRDLLLWQMQSGRRSGLVFPNKDGEPWSEKNYAAWREVFRRAAPTGVRPYDLRHSYASLRFAEGKNPSWVAEQLGHTLEMLLETYVHVIGQLGSLMIEDADELILDAKQKTDRCHGPIEAAAGQ